MDEQNMEVLQENHALEVLIQILEEPGMLRTTLYEKVMKKNAAKQTLIKRVNELASANLIEIKQSKTHKAGQYLYLTDQGQRIAELAVKMRNVITGDTNQDDNQNHGSPEKIRNTIKG